MAMALITVHCKLFKMMPYIIILKVRKSESFISTARENMQWGGGGTIPPSLNKVKALLGMGQSLF